MKVKDLIVQLQDFDPEMVCYVEANHGHHPQRCGGAQERINLDNKNEYYAETTAPADLPDDEIDEWLIEYDEWPEIKTTNPRLCLIYA